MNSARAESREIVWRHLAELPAFLALQRSIEDRLTRALQPFEAPALDVGAGDGHFASAAFGRAVEFGVDLDSSRMKEARGRRVYRVLIRAGAEALPFADGAVATVLCNSALEHMPEAEAALAEMARVLRPGGRLILSVPTDRFEANFLIPALLRSVGLRGAAERYARWFRAKQKHYWLLSREEWIATVERAGLRVESARRYMSARATKWFEAGHYLGAPSLVVRALTGRWVVWAWRPRFALVERLLARFVDEPEREDDSCLFVAARKD